MTEANERYYPSKRFTKIDSKGDCLLAKASEQQKCQAEAIRNSPTTEAVQCMERWVCPSDRHLMLRSKLGAGWSNYTLRQENSLPKLSHEELQHIQDVVRRSAEIDATEMQRVGRFVDNVERLKSLAVGDGLRECFLCGVTFTLLMSPKLCSECQLKFCMKCGCFSRIKGMQVMLSPKSAVKWYCKICKEQKELWKKSGAWFYNSLPSYILPERSPSRFSPKNAGATNPLKLRRLSSVTYEGSGRRKSSTTSEDDFVPLRSATSTPTTSRKPGQENNSLSAEEQTKTYGTNISDSRRALELKRAANSVSTSNATKSTPSSSPVPKSEQNSMKQDPEKDASQNLANQIPEINQSYPDSGLGQLHFVLQYIIQKSTLYIRIIKGINLIAKDANGLSDPYIKIHLLPDTGKKTKLRTRTCQRTLNPIWDEEFTYAGVSMSDLENKMLRLSVLDEDTIGFDWLGEILFPLKSLANGKKEYMEYYLQSRCEELEKTLMESEDDRGKILIGLYYSPAKSELTVTTFQCVNLIAMDSNGYSDPFVKLYLKPDKDKSSKYKTDVKKKTLNPVFNEDFVYNVSPQEMPKKTLEVTVWDKDFGTQNDFIGALMLGNTCKGERWNHWEILLKQPYQRHDRWHSLHAELQPSSP